MLVRFAIILWALNCSAALQAEDQEAIAVKAAADKAAEKATAKKAEKPAVKAEEKPAAAKAEAAKAPARVIVVPAAAAAEVNADDGQVLQYEQMMRPKMWRELEFIRQNCDLTPEQRPKIKAAAQASVKQVAKDIVHKNQGRIRGDVSAGTVIRKDLLKTLEQTLTPEQMARYQEVAVRRTASIKNTTIRSTVARLDSFLYLSREQRDKISATLSDNWREEWEQWLMLSMYGGMYFPTIPDKDLLPHLSAQQKQVWQGAQKIMPGFWGGEQVQDDDEWWNAKEEVDQPKAKAGEADAKPAGEGDK
ncbi:MAG: hypothetical protein JWN70_4818 [Planctomycetaceae bacterium]|nr:hypothetical protein [Planctomycetaceae bacterium]